MAGRIILDWDGPVVNGQPAKDASWLLAALEVSGQLPHGLFDQLCRGGGIEQAGVCRLFHLDVEPDALARIRGRIRGTLLDSPQFCRPACGAVAFLEMAHAAGIMTAVVTQTTAQTVRDQIRVHGIPDHFAHIEAAGDPFYERFAAGLDAKAVAYAVACRRLEVSPWQALAVEDSSAGAAAAGRVGIPVIGVSLGAGKPIPEANSTVTDLAALAQRPIVQAMADQPPQQFLRNLPALAPGRVARAAPSPGP